MTFQYGADLSRTKFLDVLCLGKKQAAHEHKIINIKIRRRLLHRRNLCKPFTLFIFIVNIYIRARKSLHYTSLLQAFITRKVQLLYIWVMVSLQTNWATVYWGRVRKSNPGPYWWKASVLATAQPCSLANTQLWTVTLIQITPERDKSVPSFHLLSALPIKQNVKLPMGIQRSWLWISAKTRCLNEKLVTHESKAFTVGANYGFCGMKELGILLLL